MYVGAVVVVVVVVKILIVGHKLRIVLCERIFNVMEEARCLHML